MRRVFVITALLCAVCAGAVRAQFNIPTVESPDLNVTPIVDSLRAVSIDNRYFSRARWRAERLAQRKERNTVEFNINLAASQTQFVNWQSGGENTFSARSTIYFRHLYKHEKLTIDYRFDARYGANYIAKKMFKNEDEFKVNFQTAWKMHRNWSYAATVSTRSQFTKGVRSRTDTTKVSDFMAPGFLDISVGFNWKRKGSPWDITISPVTGSIIFMLDEQLRTRGGVSGVPAGNRTKGQLGPSLNIFFDKEFYKKVFRYRSNLYTFTNIKTAPRVRWENTLEIKATKVLSTKLYGFLYYDKYSGTTSAQYNYSISVGLSYWIKNK